MEAAPWFIDAGKHFNLARYRFYLVAVDHFRLPAYKGALFHGGLGWLLREISPDAYSFLYEPQLLTPAVQGFPKPYVLSPPLDDLTYYQPGMPLTLDLTLIGDAIAYFPECFAAVSILGKRGLGKDRGQFRLVRVEQLQIPEPYLIYDEAEQVFSDPGKPLTWDDITRDSQGLRVNWVRIQCLTRLRIKKDNRLVGGSLPFDVLIGRLLTRIEFLGKMYHDEEVLTSGQKTYLIKKAKEVKIIEDRLVWKDWKRYSGRQKTWMKFGGLLGTITYEGDLSEFLPYLVLGQWIHVGGKSTFGLGAYRLMAGEH